MMKESDAMRDCREGYIKDRAAERLSNALAEKGAELKADMWRSFRDNDFLTVKIWDLVRDAFYEGRELGPWPETLTEDDKHSAWLGSKSREQTQGSFPWPRVAAKTNSNQD